MKSVTGTIIRIEKIYMEWTAVTTKKIFWMPSLSMETL